MSITGEARHTETKHPDILGRCNESGLQTLNTGANNHGRDTGDAHQGGRVVRVESADKLAEVLRVES